MSAGSPDDTIEQRLRGLHPAAGSEAFRTRLLASVDEALAAERETRGGGRWQPYGPIAACLVVGLALAQIATSADPMFAGVPAARSPAAVPADQLRRLAPDVPEADARCLLLLESSASGVLPLPDPQGAAPIRAPGVPAGEIK